MSTTAHTPGTDAAFGLVREVLLDSERDSDFPNRASFIAADHPDFAAMIRRAVAEGRPAVVVWPGGDYLIVEGQAAADDLAGRLHLA